MEKNSKTVTVYSTRGGNGKTITSVMLAIASAKRNLKTVLIDADLEAPSLLHLVPPKSDGLTWVNFLEEDISDRINVKDLPRNCGIKNLDIIYSPPPRVGKNFLSWKSREWWQHALKRSMIAEEELVESGYDVIIIDNQSGTSLNSVNNMVLADASIMVIRPATYGLGAAENFIGEMYRILHDMKPRKDYYIWNQVQQSTNEHQQRILGNFLEKWETKLEVHGLKYGGRINFNPTLNLGLLDDEPNLFDYFSEVSDPISNLLSQILDE